MARLDHSSPFLSGPLTDLIEQNVLHAGLDRVLCTVRRHLGMDVAFISRFREVDRVFEHVDAEGTAPIQRGDVLSLEEGYCLKVVRGELPGCIPDTSRVSAAMRIPATRDISIGAHLSVPIRLESGTVYGTLCCFSHASDPTIGERDMALMHAFADVIGARIDEAVAADVVYRHDTHEIRHAMASGAPRMVFQPIYDLSRQRMRGVEALARFDVPPARGPDRWFDMAERVGLGAELELKAVTEALPALDLLPPPMFLCVNVSPALVYADAFRAALAHRDVSRLVIEITEHVTVTDYAALCAALKPLRERGLRVAVDDAGAGFASMRHILNIEPSVIKLDMSLTRDIDTDDRRRALAKGLIAFAHEIGCFISAEGVETDGELGMLGALGVDMAQGYFFDRPLPLDDLLARLPMPGMPAPVSARSLQYP